MFVVTCGTSWTLAIFISWSDHLLCCPYLLIWFHPDETGNTNGHYIDELATWGKHGNQTTGVCPNKLLWSKWSRSSHVWCCLLLQCIIIMWSNIIDNLLIPIIYKLYCKQNHNQRKLYRISIALALYLQMLSWLLPYFVQLRESVSDKL